MSREEFLEQHFWWLGSYHRKYGGPDVKVDEAKKIGNYDSETLRNLPAKRYFLKKPLIYGKVEEFLI
jgi:hypothetical protein